MLKIMSILKKIVKKTILIFYNISFINGLNKHKYLNSQETVDYLLDSNKSLIRWGDGESALLFGKGIEFQKGNSNLSAQLNEIITSYSHVSSNYLLAAPNEYLQYSFIKLIRMKKVGIWSRTRYVFGKYVLNRSVFGDAFLFRPLSPLTNNSIKRLWENNDLIFVHANQSVYLDFVKKNPDNKCVYVRINERNAFEDIDNIINEIKLSIKTNNFDKKNTKILICAGPTAKIISYRLSYNNYICYDLGHYFEWKFYDRTNKKGI